MEESWCAALEDALGKVGDLTAELGGRGARGNVDGMLAHSVDYLQLCSIVVVAWQWIALARAARSAMNEGEIDADYAEGLLCAAQYWLSTELPRVETLAKLCHDAEDSYLKMKPEWF